jgi:hypothetical protein
MTSERASRQESSDAVLVPAPAPVAALGRDATEGSGSAHGGLPAAYDPRGSREAPPSRFADVADRFNSPGASSVIADRGRRGEGMVSTADAAQSLERARDTQLGTDGGGGERLFRVPTGGDIKSMLVSGSIPEDKLIASIETALMRMQKEGRLKSKDALPDIMKQIFPKPKVFDEVAFAAVVDVADRSKIYQSLTDAQTKLNSTDKPKLLAVMDDAIVEITTAMADGAGLTAVFGTMDATAKAVYGNAKTLIASHKLTIDASMHTDYNRDDEEVGLGGWANFGSKQVHLQRKIAEVQDKNAAISTVVHEFCHLADATVKDKGYYASPGFEGMTEADKVTNAAHFEELPRRKLGTSKFVGHTFTPGKVVGGGAMTFEDEVRRGASEYLRKAWDKAVDCHLFLRRIKGELDAGNLATFTAKQARIIEISKLQHLTIHEQKPPSTINMNDIVLCEGVAHATTIIRRAAAAQVVPASAAVGKTFVDYVPGVVSGAIKSYGALTGSDVSDQALMDWLVAEYKKAL